MSKKGKVVAAEYPHESEHLLIRGKYVILAILALALAATGYAAWYRYQQSRQAIALWGPAHAGRIRNAAEVEVWRIADADAEGEAVAAPAGAQAKIKGRRVLQNIPDLTYIRRAFLTDAFFRWEEAPSDCAPPSGTPNVRAAIGRSQLARRRYSGSSGQMT